MRKLFLPLSIVFAVLICVPACRVIPDEKKTIVRESRDQQQALTAGDAVLNAIRSGNYKAYAKYFGDMVTEQEFQASQKSLHAQFGTLEKYEYLTALETPLVDNNIWRVTFRRKDSKGRIVLQQVLFRFVSGIGDDGKFRVIGMAFL